MAVVDRATEIPPRHPARRELELQFGTLGPHAAGIGGDEREGLRVLEVDLEILVLVAVQRNVRSQLAIEQGRFQTTFKAAGTFRFEHQIVTRRSEEHTSELQSLMRISYAVFCLKKKKTNQI